MTARLRILGLCLLISVGGAFVPLAAAQTAAEPAGKLKTHHFKQDDYRRRYKLYSPRNETALKGPRPIVLVIHGGGSSDRGMVKLDKKRWQELADTHGFYVAYPNAIDKLWDFGEGLISEA